MYGGTMHKKLPLSSKIINCAYFDFGDWAVVKHSIWRMTIARRGEAQWATSETLQDYLQNGKILHQDSTMPLRRQRNIERVDVQAELNELRQSKQTLQQMMTELLHRILTPDNLSRQSSVRDLDFEDHSTTSAPVSESALVNPWSMDRLACALENTD
ncbi:Ubiquitin carboxyl-terminal hydrolase [Actinidia chinensis var. chinensis]|uniref:Ubiquitin carboxyl-terminal hydrolase n=1 Tax=Actinidia chinensis var. chinensis TaxID=1590841 RepID=A0A2R6S0L2_ACTCC|nr:Ubiquitin carboxyl-terminal hydrolase [Actinidia chinensis var. chinensis]